ncbi:hypothetical protein K523DRAFT_324942 [Schizophyllum commune Tattone D]|nr:hypothetical protein K523DRAFT_324942 [Schizophyllum commune Tattone D]
MENRHSHVDIGMGEANQGAHNARRDEGAPSDAITCIASTEASPKRALGVPRLLSPI